MESKKKILFITSSLNLGGAERQLLLLCEYLKSDLEVQIIALAPDGPLKNKYLQIFPDTIFINVKNILSQILELIKIIRNSNPDLVVTWLYKADLFGALAAKLAGGIPVVWSARNSSIPNFSLFKKIILAIFSRIFPKEIVANATPAFKFHVAIGYPREKISIIPNLLSSWTMEINSKSFLLSENFSKNKLRMGIAARQVSGKGILETIKVIDENESHHPQIELAIIGQQTDESKHWDSLGMYGNHKVKALSNDKDLAEWFQNLDLYLMSSTSWESQPNSLLEAIAIGCPILVADVIELDFLIPGIFKYNPNDLNSLFLKIDFLYENRVLVQTEMKTLIQTLSEVYSAERILEKWKSVIFRIVNK